MPIRQSLSPSDRLMARSTAPAPLSAPLAWKSAQVRRWRRAGDVGNTLATAQPLTGFPGRRSVSNTVSQGDVDVYAITVTDITDLRVITRNRSQFDLFSSLLDSQGQIWNAGGESSKHKLKPGQALNSFYEELPAGTYYVRLKSRSDRPSRYKLTLEAKNTFPELPDCGCGDS